MAQSAEQVGAWILRYIPMITMFAFIVASATAAQLQINANAGDIQDNSDAIKLRVPTFLYDRDRSQTTDDLTKLVGSVELNEEVVKQLERSTDQIDSKIELEIERLRSLIAQSDREQGAKLELILKLLERELEGGIQ